MKRRNAIFGSTFFACGAGFFITKMTHNGLVAGRLTGHIASNISCNVTKLVHLLWYGTPKLVNMDTVPVPAK